jgi:hypothetical protein
MPFCRCSPLRLAGRTTLGVALLAATAPLVAGAGLGAAVAGAALLVKRARDRRGWSDEPTDPPVDVIEDPA